MTPSEIKAFTKRNKVGPIGFNDRSKSKAQTAPEIATDTSAQPQFLSDGATTTVLFKGQQLWRHLIKILKYRAEFKLRRATEARSAAIYTTCILARRTLRSKPTSKT